MVDLTEHLGKEETVALLKGDTLPVDIVRPSFFLFCRMRMSIGPMRTWSTCRRARSEQGGRTW